MSNIKAHGKIIDTIRELIGENDALRDLRIKCQRANKSKVWFEFDGLSNDEAVQLLADQPDAVFYEGNSIVLSSDEEISERLFDHIRGANNPRSGRPYHVENLETCNISHYYYYNKRIIKIESTEFPTKYYSVKSDFLDFWGWH